MSTLAQEELFWALFFMGLRDSFFNISPLDHRYWQANPVLFDSLAETLSEQAAVRYMVRAEAALLTAHIHSHINSDPELLRIVHTLEDIITPDEVAQEEENTHHNIRALVHVIQRHIPERLTPWVHLGATSVDILDTATAMRLRDVMRKTVIPLLLELLNHLIELSEMHAETPQAGRTHGQLAVPITFGYAIAEYVSRLGQSVAVLEKHSANLRGKLSGAVGAYNATKLIVSDPMQLERDYLNALGLQRSDYANQIVEPEHLLRMLLEINTAFGIIANLADDLRHLQRTEIDEVAESFGPNQVGSSTMPQKRNPWNSEHVKSLWKAFAPRIMSFYMDQISEHQRDLSNSASGRFVADYIAGFSAAAARMNKIVSNLTIHTEKMVSNLSVLGEGILAEPTYILLALSAYPNAHEIVRKATLAAHNSGQTLKNFLKTDTEIWETLHTRLTEVLGISAEDFYSNPCKYTGMAADRTRSLCAQFRTVSREVQEKIKR